MHSLYLCLVKRLLAILFLLTYSFSVLGSHVHVHYCMNKIAGWSLIDDPSDKECDRCGMKNTKCCKTEMKENKSTSEQISPVQIISDFHAKDILQVHTEASVFFTTTLYKNVVQISPHAPPLHSSIDPFSSYCIFRI